MPLYKHQANHVEKYWDKKAWGLWHDLGLGKTATVLHHARQLFNAGYIDGVVVMAPAECYMNWLKEIPKHVPEMSAVAWESGHVRRSYNNLIWLAEQKYQVFVINVEAMSRDKPTVWSYLVNFVRNRNILLIVDESSCIKNPKAKCTKNIMTLSRYCAYRRALNGVPGIESPFDVWSQLEYLSPNCTGYNYFMFTKTYGVWERQYYGPRNFDKVVGYRNVDQVRKLLERHGDFLRKEECLDLPAKLYETYHVKMPDELMKVYNDMKKRQIAMLEDNTVIAADNALDLATKLHDIATGFIKHEDGKIEWLTVHKIEKLIELLKSLNGQVIIYCSSRPTIDRLGVALRYSFPGKVDEIHGGVDMDERPEIIEKFQKGEIDYLICNQQTAGRGVTLTAASYVIYFRNGYSLERRVQSEDRAHRIGQDKNVTYIDVVCDGTIDERVVNALDKKLDVASVLLNIVNEELFANGRLDGRL